MMCNGCECLVGLTVLEGTTFESSTCDYSDDLQILLESEGGKNDKRRTNEAQTQERPGENVGRQHRQHNRFFHIRMTSL